MNLAEALTRRRARRFQLAVLGALVLGLVCGPALSAPFESLTAEQKRQDIDEFIRAVEATHPAPFRIHGKSEWQQAASALKARVDSLDVNGYFFELQRIAGLADDIHTSFFPLPDAGVLTKTYPLRLRALSDGIYVRAAAPEYSDAVGSRILRIGKLQIDEAVARIRALTPGSSAVPLDNVPLTYLLTPGGLGYIGALGADGDAMDLSLIDRTGRRRAAQIKPVAVSLLDAYETGTMVGWQSPADWQDIFAVFGVAHPASLGGERMQWLEARSGGKALYIKVNGTFPDTDRSAQKFAAQLLDRLIEAVPERLVVDLRDNQGGWFVLTSMLPPIVAAFPNLQERNRVFVLVGPDTASAGVVLAAQFEREVPAIIVGQSTATPPNFYATYKPTFLTNTRMAYRIAREFHLITTPADKRRFMAPDVAVPESIADLKRGTDRALDVALTSKGVSEPETPWYERWRRPSQAAALTGTRN